MKKSFILHTDSLSVLSKLTDTQCADLFRAIRDFHLTGKEPENQLIAIIFEPFRNQFLRDQDRYEEFQKKQSDKGKRSAEAKRLKKSEQASQPLLTESTAVNHCQPDSTESTYSVSVSVSDSVSNSDSVSDNTSNKKSRAKKSSGGNRAVIYPSKEEVASYFEEKGYRRDVGERAYHYYADADWRDSKGNKVLNWKQKMGIVWFKPENEKPKANGNEALIGYKPHLHNNPHYRSRINEEGTHIQYIPL